ncbi:homogentisate phytyltransferase [Synechococcus sp. Nb3U1]|uniref:homogentisate phytyltransferase n=1 Tax=Synechococcus sp. Nb3U1 TaxID=1914529 RepID=UPI001F344B3C|nr:homogentisate phytyltransferase [Synechococcus sp. Nb3U1]MCF2970239.1 homogentisate phytyltransferase [Synechococcus sp. Nb3U1]
MLNLPVLWRFARPHTLYGTSASVLGLYLLAGFVAEGSWGSLLSSLPSLLLAWGACLAANVYIVGLNQLTDIEIDRINKPHLPLAAGSLTWAQAVGIVSVCGVGSVLLAAMGIPYLVLTVLLSNGIGTAYSLPPFRLKRFPLAASACIYCVRGLIVNLGLYSYFQQLLQARVELSAPIVLLTGFMSIFGLVIALYKDIPDMEGDRKFAIATFSLQFGQERISTFCIGILACCYLGLIGLGSGLLPVQNGIWLLVGHVLGLGILLGYGIRLDTTRREAIVNYYQLIWKLFYLEYLLYPWAFF